MNAEAHQYSRYSCLQEALPCCFLIAVDHFSQNTTPTQILPLKLPDTGLITFVVFLFAVVSMATDKILVIDCILSYCSTGRTGFLSVSRAARFTGTKHGRLVYIIIIFLKRLVFRMCSTHQIKSQLIVSYGCHFSSFFLEMCKTVYN